MYTIKIDQPAKISLDDENVSRDEDFGTKIVIVNERFAGMTSKGFEFTLPPEVFAVKRFKLQFDYFGGSIQLNHLSRSHQSSFEISNENLNSWETQVYIEEF